MMPFVSHVQKTIANERHSVSGYSFLDGGKVVFITPKITGTVRLNEILDAANAGTPKTVGSDKPPSRTEILAALGTVEDLEAKGTDAEAKDNYLKLIKQYQLMLLQFLLFLLAYQRLLTY